MEAEVEVGECVWEVWVGGRDHSGIGLADLCGGTEKRNMLSIKRDEEFAEDTK
jgi:hypothetical protein